MTKIIIVSAEVTEVETAELLAWEGIAAGLDLRAGAAAAAVIGN